MTTVRPPEPPHGGVIGYLAHLRQCALRRAESPLVPLDDAMAERQWAAELAAAIDYLRLAPRWARATSPLPIDLAESRPGGGGDIGPNTMRANVTPPPSERPKLTLIRGDQH